MIIYASPRPNEYNKEPKPSLGQKMTTIQKGLKPKTRLQRNLTSKNMWTQWRIERVSCKKPWFTKKRQVWQNASWLEPIHWVSHPITVANFNKPQRGPSLPLWRIHVVFPRIMFVNPISHNNIYFVFCKSNMSFGLVDWGAFLRSRIGLSCHRPTCPLGGSVGQWARCSFDTRVGVIVISPTVSLTKVS